jgi:hypothetical protein
MKAQLYLMAAAAIAALVCANNVHADVIDVLVGDKDGFGFSPPCPDTGTCPGLNNPVIDNRDAAEKAATNGAQITDEYSATFPPSFSPPDSTSTADVLFPFTGTLRAATLSFAGGDFQSDVFGPLTANINGVSVPFFFADGRFVTTIHSFTLDAAELAAANATGVVDLHLDRNGSGDFISFDWFELVGTTAVPEPASLIILGGALFGFGLMHRRNLSRQP